MWTNFSLERLAHIPQGCSCFLEWSKRPMSHEIVSEGTITDVNGDEIGVEIFFQDGEKIIQIGMEMVRLNELVKFVEASP